MNLVMILLVKDEVDIVAANIRWHLGSGIDRIVVVDNGSTDGTLAKIHEFAGCGRVSLIEDKGLFQQDKITTRSAEYARDVLNADWIISADADELWCARSGDLKDELANTPHSMLFVPVVNFVPTALDDPGDTCPVSRMQFKVVRPVGLPGMPDLLRVPEKKAMFRARDLRRIHNGNHAAELSSGSAGAAANIEIHHYPIRSREHFFGKVIKGGEALTRAGYDAKVGYHWRRWYRLHQDGKLDKEWRRLCPHRLRLAMLLGLGIVTKDATIRRRLGELDARIRPELAAELS